MTRSNRSPLAAALFVLVLVVAACGNDDGEAVHELGNEAGSASGVAGGSGSASGSASAPEDDAADGGAEASADGGYEYASDVSAHRLVVLDVCEINALLDADPIDFGAVARLYAEGEHSVNSDGSVRTLAGFATATDRRHGLDEYYDTPTPLDDFVTEALEGADRFGGEPDAVRRQGVQKGIQNQVLTAWVVHELRSALAKAADGDFDPATGAPHNWDEAWAFHHGAAPECAPFATANSRAANFGTLADDGETARANEALLEAMIAGRDALLAEDLEGAVSAGEAAIRSLVIPYAQATVRYATLAADDVTRGDRETTREHQAEGLAFFRVIESLVAERGADVATVNDILGLDAEPAANGDGEDVRDALQPALDDLSITDDDIGQLE